MRFAGLVLFILIPFAVASQQPVASSRGKILDHYIQDFSKIDGRNASTADLSNIIKLLEQKDIPTNSTLFCSMLLQKVRHKFLKRYTQFATFRETINSGRYNCLTGTALYGMLLDYFNIEYSIIETNYHIFLLASTSEGTVLFEATDPVHGFVSNPDEVKKRILYYKQNVIEPEAKNKKYYEYTFELYKTVTLLQTKGLMYYNLSIDAYNRQNFESSIYNLAMALDMYNSPRMHEFSSILLLAVVDSKLDKNVKDNYVNLIQEIRKKRAPVMASRN